MSLTSSPFAVSSFACVCVSLCVCVSVCWSVRLFVASHTAVARSALNALVVAFAVVALYYCNMRLNVCLAHLSRHSETGNRRIEKEEEQMEAPLAGAGAGCQPYCTLI